MEIVRQAYEVVDVVLADMDGDGLIDSVSELDM